MFCIAFKDFNPMTIERLVVVALLVHLLSVVGRAQVNEVSEPLQEARLEIDSQVVPLSYDTPTQIQIGGNEVQATLRQRNERLLNLQHISFRYPAYFKYKMSRSRRSDEPVRWDLEGHEIELAVFRASAEKLRYKDADHPWSDWLSKIFEQGAVERICPILSVKAMDLKGTGYAIPLKSGMIDTKLLVDVYEVPGNFGRVRYFLLLTGWNGEDPRRNRLCVSCWHSRSRSGKNR
jgi:hypothetical protein